MDAWYCSQPFINVGSWKSHMWVRCSHYTCRGGTVGNSLVDCSSALSNLKKLGEKKKKYPEWSDVVEPRSVSGLRRVSGWEGWGSFNPNRPLAESIWFFVDAHLLGQMAHDIYPGIPLLQWYNKYTNIAMLWFMFMTRFPSMPTYCCLLILFLQSSYCCSFDGKFLLPHISLYIHQF